MHPDVADILEMARRPEAVARCVLVSPEIVLLRLQRLVLLQQRGAVGRERIVDVCRTTAEDVRRRDAGTYSDDDVACLRAVVDAPWHSEVTGLVAAAARHFEEKCRKAKYVAAGRP
jgi:hypothetical protein